MRQLSLDDKHTRSNSGHAKISTRDKKKILIAKPRHQVFVAELRPPEEMLPSRRGSYGGS